MNQKSQCGLEPGRKSKYSPETSLTSGLESKNLVYNQDMSPKQDSKSWIW